MKTRIYKKDFSAIIYLFVLIACDVYYNLFVTTNYLQHELHFNINFCISSCLLTDGLLKSDGFSAILRNRKTKLRAGTVQAISHFAMRESYKRCLRNYTNRQVNPELSRS